MTNNKVINNAKWIIICRIVQSLIQMVIGMISARYLGPGNYGLIGYAGSVVGFALPIMQLGLNSTLVHELVETPEQEGKIMGTALVMDIVSSIGCMLLVAGFVSVANRGETETIIVCILYSTMLLFRALELMQCWFQYKLESKYASIAALCAYVVVSAYKIYVLATAKSVYWFAVVNSIDFGIAGIALVALYYKCGGQSLSFSWKMCRRLFSKGKYYILSSMMAIIVANTDHIMLKMMLGDVENGYYTAAVTCTCICTFVYYAIIDSARPGILEAKKNHPEAYEEKVASLYTIIVYLTLLQGIGTALFAKLIVRVLYGEAYLHAVPVLRILAWQVGFNFIGTVRDVWILAEEKNGLLLKLNTASVATNVLINALLIPKYGASGAAIASLATQAFTNVVLGFALKPVRANNRLLLKGLNPRYLIEELRG